MRKAAAILCAITVCLIVAGTAQERAWALEEIRKASTSSSVLVQIQKNAREVNSEKVDCPDEPDISDKELKLLALVTMAEAEGESELGKRLVIDTVLNRVDSPYFPDTITDVIWQKSQFESMWNGRADRCAVTDEALRLAKEELKDRTNCDVLYFRTKHFSKYGSPLFQEGNHYFSSL